MLDKNIYFNAALDTALSYDRDHNLSPYTCDALWDQFEYGSQDDGAPEEITLYKIFFEQQFNGTLGWWNGDDYDSQLARHIALLLMEQIVKDKAY